MAATYEPIYGLSEDEVSFTLNKALFHRRQSKMGVSHGGFSLR